MQRDDEREWERDDEVLNGLLAQLKAEDPSLVRAFRTGNFDDVELGPVTVGIIGATAATATTMLTTLTMGPGLGGFVGAMGFTAAFLVTMTRWRCPGRRNLAS